MAIPVLRAEPFFLHFWGLLHGLTSSVDLSKFRIYICVTRPPGMGHPSDVLVLILVAVSGGRRFFSSGCRGVTKMVVFTTERS